MVLTQQLHESQSYLSVRDCPLDSKLVCGVRSRVLVFVEFGLLDIFNHDFLQLQSLELLLLDLLGGFLNMLEIVDLLLYLDEFQAELISLHLSVIHVLKGLVQEVLEGN